MKTPEKNVAVLAAGTWGMALAKVLWDKDVPVRIWDYSEENVKSLSQTRKHPNLPTLEIPESITITNDMAEALEGAQIAVMVAPSFAMRSTCELIRDCGAADKIETLVLCSKGIETSTLKLMDEVAVDVLGESYREKVVVLSGPSHAEEVVRNVPTTLASCSVSEARAEEVQALFFQPYFRVYTHYDVMGAELGGAVKNVIAIAAGVSDGFGYGDNTRAAIITRSLAEMIRLGVTMGAQRDTFMGLSGMGDLIVTATSMHSRNHRFGEFLSQGKNADEAIEAVGMVVEGYLTCKAVHELAEKHDVEMPICDAVFEVLYEGKSAKEAVVGLMAREAKAESLYHP